MDSERHPDRNRLGLVPLTVPITLLRPYVGKGGLSYLQAQVYLDPHPKEFMLLDHL